MTETLDKIKQYLDALRAAQRSPGGLMTKRQVFEMTNPIMDLIARNPTPLATVKADTAKMMQVAIDGLRIRDDEATVKRVADAMRKTMRTAGIASSTTEYFDRMARAAIEELNNK